METTSQLFENGNALYESGDYAAAIEAYRRAESAGYGDRAAVHNNVGLALCQMGKTQEGVKEFRYALALAPRDADLLSNIGEALIELENPTEAVEALQEAAALAPDDAATRVALAQAFCLVGKYARAVEQYDAAVALDPSDSESAALAERLRLHLKQAEEASRNAVITMPEAIPPPQAPSPAAIEIVFPRARTPRPEVQFRRGFRIKNKRPSRRPRMTPAEWKDAGSRIFWRIVGFVLVFHVIILILLYINGCLNEYIPQEIRIPIIMAALPPSQISRLPASPLGELRRARPRHLRTDEHPRPQVATRSRALTVSVRYVAPPALAPEPAHAKLEVPEDAPDATDAPPDPGRIAVKGPTSAGDVPVGFSSGRIDGQVYFIRLKHDTGDWYAHTEGIAALLAFMSKYFRCETASRPMTAQEIETNYLSKGAIPSFIYISCDDSFSLSDKEAGILRSYLQRGGFLFVDSAPDDQTRQTVAEQLARVLPGQALQPVSQSHPINDFLFRLQAPGIGENWSDQRNYSVSLGNRVAVFYTPGNLAHYYELSRDKSDAYTAAQFEMGANVVAYAIAKGVRSEAAPGPAPRQAALGTASAGGK